MDCRIIKVDQNSDEWLALRRCRITASRLADVMAKPTTQRYQQYQRELSLELLGYEHVEESPEWARHGREMEPRAIGAYEWKYGQDMEHDLFLIHKEHDWLGASPDMMTTDYTEGAEIKCRALYKNYRHYRQLAEQMSRRNPLKACPPENRHQVQGSMWVTGFSSWWYVGYYEGEDLSGNPQRKIYRVEIPRDQDLIDKMELRCLEFMKEVYEATGSMDGDYVTNSAGHRVAAGR